MGLAMIAGLALTAVGAATSAALGTVGLVNEYEQQKANAEAQAEMAAQNARLAERDAAAEEAAAQEEARRAAIEAEKQKAQQRALLGASGAAITSGSPLALLGESAAAYQIEQNDILAAGSQRAGQHRQAAEQYRYQQRQALNSVKDKTSLNVAIGGQWAGAVGKVGSSIMSAAMSQK